MIRFRGIIMIAFSFSLMSNAAGQSLSSKQITLLHGFGAGGNADTMARILGEAMSRNLGQTIVVEPKPGASGVIASQILSRAPADGHTLLMLTAAHATTATLNKNIKYDPVEDFSMLSTVGFFPYILAVNKANPVQSLTDLIQRSKQFPGSISFTSVGLGSVPHLTAELLANETGIKMIHVPYQGGAAPVLDVLGGRVDILVDTPTVTMPHIKEGTLRGIGVTSKKEWPAAPGIPSISGSVPGFEVETWIGLATVKGTPKEIVDRLQAAAVSSLNLPDVKAKLSELGADVRSSTPNEMTKLVREEIARWRAVIERAGIKEGQ